MWSALKNLFASKTTWWAVVGSAVMMLAAKLVVSLWEEYRAKQSEEDKRVRASQKNRLALLEALQSKNSGLVSRIARNRAARLRILLDGLHTPGAQPPHG